MSFILDDNHERTTLIVSGAVVAALEYEDGSRVLIQQGSAFTSADSPAITYYRAELIEAGKVVGLRSEYFRTQKDALSHLDTLVDLRTAQGDASYFDALKLEVEE